MKNNISAKNINTKIVAQKNFNKIFKRALYKIPYFEMPANVVIKKNTLLREDLNMDSLDIMETVIELEKKYKMNLYRAQPNAIETVEHVYELFASGIERKERAKMLYHRAQSRFMRIHKNNSKQYN